MVEGGYRGRTKYEVLSTTTQVILSWGEKLALSLVENQAFIDASLGTRPSKKGRRQQSGNLTRKF